MIPTTPGVYIVDLGAEAIARGATVTVRSNRVMVQQQVHHSRCLYSPLEYRVPNIISN